MMKKALDPTNMEFDSLNFIVKGDCSSHSLTLANDNI